MSDSNLITVKGRVGTEPSVHITPTGRRLVKFRLGSTGSFMDQGTGQWRDQPTEWFTVKVWGPAGDNIPVSLGRGTPVIIQGELSSEEWTTPEGLRHANVITSRSIGVDVRYGEVRYTKVTRATPAAESAPSAGSGDSADVAAGEDATGDPDEDTEEYLAPEPVDPPAWEKVAR